MGAQRPLVSYLPGERDQENRLAVFKSSRRLDLHFAVVVYSISQALAQQYTFFACCIQALSSPCASALGVVIETLVQTFTFMSFYTQILVHHCTLSLTSCIKQLLVQRLHLLFFTQGLVPTTFTHISCLHNVWFNHCICSSAFI